MRSLPWVLVLAGCPLPSDTGKPEDTGDELRKEDESGCGWDCGDSATDDTDWDTDADVDTDTDTDVDTDWDADTGLMQMYWYGAVQTDGASLLGGGFGVAYWGFRAGEFLCSDLGVWVDAGPAPAGCPDCLWSFDTVSSSSVVEGEFCAEWGFSDDDLVVTDRSSPYYGYTQWAFPVGYSTSYTYAGALLDQAMFLYVEDGGWSLFFYNYGAYRQIEGGASDMTFFRPGWDSVGSPIYYYYYL